MRKILSGLLKPKGDTVKGILEGAGELAKDIRESITGDDPELEKKVIELEATLRSEELRQASGFAKNWRPFMGWCCGVAIAVNFIIRPLAAIINVEVPEMDIVGLIAVAGPFIILGSARTVEKIQGVVGRH